MTTIRLTRSLLDRVFGGVCGGIGYYLGSGGWWVRLAFMILTLVSPALGILSYLLMWMLLPGQGFRDLPTAFQYSQPRSLQYARPENMLLLGLFTVIIGIVVLLQTTGLFQGPQGDLLAPALLFLLGFVVLIKHLRGQA